MEIVCVEGSGELQRRNILWNYSHYLMLTVCHDQSWPFFNSLFKITIEWFSTLKPISWSLAVVIFSERWYGSCFFLSKFNSQWLKETILLFPTSCSAAVGGFIPYILPVHAHGDTGTCCDEHSTSISWAKLSFLKIFLNCLNKDKFI